MAADHLDAPVPTDEHLRLAAFAGEWRGEETVFASRWVEGGEALAPAHDETPGKADAASTMADDVAGKA